MAEIVPINQLSAIPVLRPADTSQKSFGGDLQDNFMRRDSSP
jgi:hypothetical protein